MSSHESGPGAGTFPRCPGIPGSGGPPALFQSVSLGRRINHSALRMGQMLCQFRQNLPQNLQPGQAWAHPAQGLVCEKGIKVPGNRILEDCMRRLLGIAMHHAMTSTTLTFMPLATPFPSPALGLPALDPCQIPIRLRDLVQVLFPLGHLFWSFLS